MAVTVALASAGQSSAFLFLPSHTGDRLSFGRAAAAVRRRRLQPAGTATVVVADNVALQVLAGESARGIASAVFVNKMAAAVAAAGGS